MTKNAGKVRPGTELGFVLGSRKVTSVLALSAVFFVMVVAGCRYSRYSVVLQNETATMLDDVKVVWDGYVSTAGLVSPGTGKMEAFPDAPFPREAHVSWVTPDGVLHEVDIDVNSVGGCLSRRLALNLVFSIQEDGTVHLSLE